MLIESRKRSIACIAVIVALVLILGALTACSSKLNGCYSRNEQGIVFQYTFDGSDKVQYEVFGSSGTLLSSDSWFYRISGKTISYSDTAFGAEKVQYSFQKKGSSIFINGNEYVKK